MLTTIGNAVAAKYRTAGMSMSQAYIYGLFHLYHLIIKYLIFFDFYYVKMNIYLHLNKTNK